MAMMRNNVIKTLKIVTNFLVIQHMELTYIKNNTNNNVLTHVEKINHINKQFQIKNKNIVQIVIIVILLWFHQLFTNIIK